VSADVTIDFHYLDRIPRGPNGKFKNVVVSFSEEVERTGS
jgi:hypothetical protein